MIDYLKMAGKLALPTIEKDPRNFWIAAVGIRNDGVVVSAQNGAVFSTQYTNYQLLPGSHAEGRVLRKLGKNGVLYVARIAKSNSDYAMSAPCGMCQTRIRSFNVSKVYYTINATQYGLWNVKKDHHKVFDW